VLLGEPIMARTASRGAKMNSQPRQFKVQNFDIISKSDMQQNKMCTTQIMVSFQYGLAI